MTKIKRVFITSLFLFLIMAPSVGAQYFTLVPEECQGTQMPGEAQCNLTSVETMAGNLASIILGLTGSLALLMFIIGGIQLILAGGQAKQYEKAKNTLTYAVLGLALILFSGALIKFLIKSLTGA